MYIYQEFYFFRNKALDYKSTRFEMVTAKTKIGEYFLDKIHLKDDNILGPNITDRWATGSQ